MAGLRQRNWRQMLICQNTIDWILVHFFAIAFLALKKAPGIVPPFSVHDQSLYYPYHENETIPVWLAVILTGVIPVIVIGLLTIVPFGYQARYRSRSLRLHDFNVAGLGFGYAVALAMIFSTSIVLLVGRPRPDTIERCQPDPAIYQNDTLLVIRGGVVDSSICTRADKYTVVGAFSSFPSGHCAGGFAGLGYLALFLDARLRLSPDHPANSNGYERMSFLKVLIVSLPILLASFISVTRVLDNRHFASDVFAGAAMGFTFAVIGFKLVVSPSDIFISDTTQHEPDDKLRIRKLPTLSSKPYAADDDTLSLENFPPAS